MATDLKKLRDELLAEQLADMAPAEEAAADASSRAGWGKVASGIAGAFGGYKPDTGFWDSMEARGRQGVADARGRSGLKTAAMGEARQISASQDAAAKEAAETDPTSTQSMADAELAGRLTGKSDLFKGMSTAQMKKAAPFLKEYFEAEQAKRDAARRDAERKDDRTYQEGRDEKLHGYRLEEAAVSAGAKAAADAAKPGPTIPASEASNIGQMSAARAMLDDLDKTWESLVSSPGSGVASRIPGTDAARYPDAQLAAAQAVGTILEKGKLTDSDLKAKYMLLVPQASDSKERKDAKIANLKRQLELAEKEGIGGLTKAGYNTKGFTQPAAPVAAPTGEVKMVGPNGEKGSVPASEVAAAEANGWKRVQ